MPRQFYGEAAEVVAAPVEDCFALLAAVDRYPDWCPDIVGDVDVLDRGPEGQPSRVRMRMHIARGRSCGSSAYFSRSWSSLLES